MASSGGKSQLYEQVLRDLDQASRQHAAIKAERQDREVDRAAAIVAVSRLGVPRATVAKLTGISKGRIQQILEQAGEAGATGGDWADPELRRLVAAAIAARPIPSAGIGLRRESTLGPHLGRGAGVAVRLTGDLEKDRADIAAMIEKLLEEVRSHKLDYLLSLSEEELDLVQGNLVDD